MQKDTQESVQIDVEQTTKSLEKEEENKEEEEQVQRVTPQKKFIDDDKDDDTMSIQGLINMDIMSPTELMEIASAKQSKAKKKL